MNSKVIDSIDNLIDDAEFKEKLEKGQAIDVNDVFNSKIRDTDTPFYMKENINLHYDTNHQIKNFYNHFKHKNKAKILLTGNKHRKSTKHVSTLHVDVKKAKRN